MIDDESLAKMQNEDRYKEFCDIFNKLDKDGISYSLGDMYAKAHTLGIAPPTTTELLKWADSLPKA